MKDPSWEDLQLFLLVAESKSLSGAAALSGLSPPTIGRRMLALERALGRSLFDRSPSGYMLMHDGRALLERVRAMDSAAQSITEWQDDVLKLPIVSVGADALTIRFLVGHLARFWLPKDTFRLCFKQLSRANLTYREATVAIACRQPETGNIALRRSVRRSYAAYCARTFDLDRHPDWVSLGTEVASEPWETWVFRQPHPWISTWTNSPHAHLDLVLNGAGRTVLPMFIGEAEPRLLRCGPRIEELEHDTWLVVHDDDRHRVEVRTLIERLAKLFDDNRLVFAPPV